MHRTRIWYHIALIPMITSSLAHGAEVNDDPTGSGSTGLYEVARAATLAKGDISANTSYETVSREEGSSNLERGRVAVGFGLSDRLEAFVNMELRVGIRRDYVLERALGIPELLGERLNDHPFATQGFGSGLGDLRLGAKYRLLGEPGSYGGVALQGMLKLPTAEESEGIGTTKVDLGMDLIGSRELGGLVGLNGMLGYNWRADPREFELANDMRFGLGLELPTRSYIRGIVELYGVNYVGEPAATPLISPGFRNYTVLQGGLRLSLHSGLALTAGVNKTLSIDDLSAFTPEEPERIGSFIQVSFSTGRPEAVALPPVEPPRPAPQNRAPSVQCHVERESVRPGESVQIVAEVDDPDGDRVTLTWQSSTGTHATLEGTRIVWTPPADWHGIATVTVTADDGHGGRATCSVKLMKTEPPAPPPAPRVRSFSCADFPLGSTRIDNRCKAVLDDVALLMRSESDADLVITGHSDSSGSDAQQQVLAIHRAGNARDYLVTTHHLDGSRIETRAASASQLVASDTAKERAQKRRIELLLSTE